MHTVLKGLVTANAIVFGSLGIAATATHADHLSAPTEEWATTDGNSIGTLYSPAELDSVI